jgi:tetratricopeptide (TPR) repeat protein
MAKKKRLNRRVLLFFCIFGGFVVLGGLYVYISNLPKDADVYIKKMQEHLAKDPKDYTEAMRLLNRAIAAGGDRPEPEYFYMMAELCFERVGEDQGLGQPEREEFYSRGLAMLQRALQQKRDFHKARRLLAQHYLSFAMRSGKLDRWKDYIDQLDVILADEQDADLYYRRGLAYKALADKDPSMLDTDMVEKALADMQKAVSLKPDNLRFWGALTWYLEQLKRLEEAEKAYKEAIAANAENAQPLVDYAVFLRRQKRGDESLKMIQEAIARNPKSPAGLVALAEYYIAREKTDDAQKTEDIAKAKKALQQAKEVDPSDIRIYFFLNRIHRVNRELLRARAVLEEGLALFTSKVDKDDASRRSTGRSRALMHFWLADVWLDLYSVEKDEKLKTKYLAEARKNYGELLRLSPKDPRQFKIAGRIAYIDRDWKQARVDFEKSLANPDLGVMIALVDVYNQLGLPGKAEEQVNRALMWPGQEQNVYFLLKRAKFRMDVRDYLAARQAVETALQVEPENVEARRLLQAIDIATKQTFQITPGAKPDPLTQTMIMRLANDFVLQDKYDQAATTLEKLVDVAPDNQRAWQQLISLWLGMGKKDHALKKIKAVIKKEPENEFLKKILVLLEAKDQQERFNIEKEFVDQIKEPLPKALAMWNLCRRYDRTDEAMKYLQQAEKIDPKDPAVVEWLFRYAVGDSDWKEAEKLIGRMTDPHQQEQKELYVARLLAAQKKFKEAIPHFEAVLTQSPHLQSVRLMLGECYLQSKNYELAKEQFNICVRNDVRNITAMAGMALVARATHDIEGHNHWVQRAYAYPDGKAHPYIKEQYLRMLMESEAGNIKKVIYDRQKTFQRNPKDINNAIQLAVLLEKDGQKDKALAKYEYVFNNIPNKIAFLPVLVNAYRRADQSSKADELFDRLQKAATDAKQKVDVYIAYGNFLALTDAAAAEKMYEKAIHADKNGTKGYKALANLRVNQAILATRAGNPEESKRKWRDAISILQNVVDVDDKDIEAKRTLYRHCIAADMLDDAIAGYRRLLDSNPTDTQAMVGLGLAYLRQNKLEDAEKEFNRAIEINPNTDEPYIFRSEIHRARGDIHGAVDDIKKAIQSSDNILLLMDLGALYEAMGNIEMAAHEYDKIVAKRPTERAAYLRLVALFSRKEMWPPLEQLAQGGMKQFPEDPSFPLALANMWDRRDQPDKKIKMLAKAMQMDPESVGLVRRYLVALLHAGRYGELTRESEKYLNRPKHKPGVMAILAAATVKRNPDDPKGFGEFLAAFKAVEVPGDVFFVQSLAKEAFGPEKLLARSAEIINTRPSDWRIYRVIGDLNLELKKYPQAEEAYNKAKTLSKTISERVLVTTRLARAYELSEQYDKVEKAYKEILSKSPNNLMALNNLAYLYTNTLNQPQKAKPLVEQALRQRPGDMNLLDTYAWTLAKLGKNKQALEYLRKVVRGGSTGVDPLYHMGHVLEQTKDLEGAKGYYRRAFESVKDEKGHRLYILLKTALQRVEKKINKKE